MTESTSVQRQNKPPKLTTCGCFTCRPVSRKYWVFGCGTFALALAIVIGVLWPILTKMFLDYQLQLRAGSLGYENWEVTPVPMYMRYKMFNWTNPEDVREPGYKPNFVEMGPYVFLEKHVRVNVSFHPENGTVSFDQIRTWHFVPEMSNGTLEDEVTNINVVAASAVYTIRTANRLVIFAADKLMRVMRVPLVVTKTVGELLFDGYDDAFLTALKKIPNIPNKPPFDKFGYFVDRNESWTYDGHFEMYSGQDDVTKMGLLTSWDYVNKTRFHHDECSYVNGTTGEPWPMGMGKGDISIFIMDICRPITLKYQRERIHNGVTGNRWAVDDRAFDNGENYAPNKCFCTDKQCPDLLPGIQNMSDCRFGGPVFASFPHFYLADKYYTDSMTGLNPSQNEHEFAVTIEPNTGIPLEIDAKLQINILVQPLRGIKLFDNVPKMMIPAFWFAQTVDLDTEKSFLAKIVSELPSYGLYVAIGFSALALLILLPGIIFSCRKSWKIDKQMQANQ